MVFALSAICQWVVVWQAWACRSWPATMEAIFFESRSGSTIVFVFRSTWSAATASYFNTLQSRSFPTLGHRMRLWSDEGD